MHILRKKIESLIEFFNISILIGTIKFYFSKRYTKF
jgi:hypothetical protein